MLVLGMKVCSLICLWTCRFFKARVIEVTGGFSMVFILIDVGGSGTETVGSTLGKDG